MEKSYSDEHSNILAIISDSYSTTEAAERVSELLGREVTWAAIRKGFKRLRKRGMDVPKHLSELLLGDSSELQIPEIPPNFNGTIAWKNGKAETIWAKYSSSSQSLDFDELQKRLLEISEPLRGKSPKLKKIKKSDKDLLVVIPIGDPHLTVYSSGIETEDKSDLSIASRDLLGGFSYLLPKAPKAETCLLVQLGDLFNQNDRTNRTPAHKNMQDISGTLIEGFLSVVKTMKESILMALEYFPKVVYQGLAGNHDPDLAHFVSICLQQYFENNPRVEVVLDFTGFQWYQFGVNMFCSHHGHGVKAADMPLFMASAKPKEWGDSIYRYAFLGHIHHQHVLKVKEYSGCIVETFNTLAAKDAYHTENGYDARRSMKMLVFHLEHGAQSRFEVDISTLRKLME